MAANSLFDIYRESGYRAHCSLLFFLCILKFLMHLFFSSCGLALSSPILIFLECFSWAHLIHVALESCISSVVNNPSLLVFCVIELLINWSNHDVILIAFRTLNLWINNDNLSFWIAAADDTSSIIVLSFSDSGERSLVISSGHSSCYVNQNGQLSQLSVKFSAKNHVLPRYEKIYVGCTFSQVIGPFNLILETLLLTNCL